MDFIDVLKQFATRAEKLKDQIQTEEATKTSLIMPFFQQVFGYDVFNPDEFVPEFTADVGIKKGEKVDYAIFIDGEPTILIEAKWCGAPLDKHDSQLFRYFGTTAAKFGILTNGLVYKFYTDLEEQNKMDLRPFLELDILDLKESLVPELKQFTKSNFNAEDVFSRASELKYSREIKNYFTEQLNDPSDDFIRYMLSHVYDGTKTQSVIEKFKPIIRTSLNDLIREMMNERITSALKSDKTTAVETPQEVPNPEPEDESPKSKIVTTEDELQAYYIIKAMLAECFDVSQITYKDTVNYFSILFNDSPTKRICRIKLGTGINYIAFPDDEKREVRHDITSLNDLFAYKADLFESASKYCEAKMTDQ